MSFLLGGPAQFSEEIRKSRFLAQAHPLSNADQASQLLAELREQASQYGATLLAGEVTALRREGDLIVADTDRGILHR